MKSNQRWMKLRTTVQLSGALSSSMNRQKPPLKREDSFIKRFSTRQIAELHDDTVDHTDEEEVNRTSTGSPKPRRKNRPRTVLTVINPYENVYFYWLCMLTICVLYNFWTAIVRQAFPELQSRARLLWYLLDGFTDLTYLIDIMVQLRTGYLEQGLIVYDSRKLARHYLKSRNFLLDLFSLMPLDLLQVLIGAHPMVRFPRFIKVYRVYNYYYMVESRTLYPNLWRVLNLVHILLLLAHWFGCFYYMLSEAEEFKGDWTYPYTYGAEFKTLTRKYLGSVYWSTLTLTTIGDLPTPESDKQYIFTIVSYLIGVFVFATIVGQVGNVITNRNANRLEFERLLDGAKLYMRHHKVPREMQRRVQRWYDYSWSRGRIQGGGDINSALGLLPDKLRTELALHVNLSTLKKVSIFKECQPEFLHDLVLKMKAYIFTPGDLICRKGEVAREMFIIADGILEVISETGKVLTTMKAGDFFGEIGILNLDGLNKRTADVRSVGYSELFSLSREDVLTAMKDYPEAQEILQSLGRKRLMDARHNKSSSASSSKRGSLSPNPDLPPDGPNTKRIVSRIRSDVSAIRNAFRRSKGMTRDLETMEMEPLTIDSRGGDEEGPTVKRILKKLGRTAGSGSSDTSGSTVRGVLKRMARVTSDEAQHGLSTAHPKTEEHMPLGSGFPLLQKLRIWTEKDDKSEEKRHDDGGIKSPVLKSVSQNTSRNNSEDTDPEIIGEGLPLFARLRLLKLKQERERMDQEEAAERRKRENKSAELKNQDINSKDTTGQDATTKSNDCLIPSSEKKETTSKGLFKSKLKATLLAKKETPSCSDEPTSESSPINDLNKGTGEKSPKSSLGNNNTISSRLGTSNEKVIGNNGKLSSSKPTNNDTITGTEESKTELATSEDKSKRRDSFKKAMKETRMDKTDEKDLNIPKSTESCSSGEENKLDREVPTNKHQKESPVKAKDNEELNLKEACSIKISDKSIESTKDLSKDRPPPRIVKVIAKKPDNCRQATLQVPSDEVSPPLSSPESTETPERKTLKSILKRISKEDSAVNLLPDGADLRRLMMAPTVQGFVARRSKFVKSVSFQRRTLRSPPLPFRDAYKSSSTPPHSISSDNPRSLSPSSLSSSISNYHIPSNKQITDVVHPRDGVQNLLRKLGSIGVDTTTPCHAEDLVRGVRKIFRDKMEDVEFAWETRIESLQQEVAIRDETIKQLTDTINRLQVVLCGGSDESSQSESENLTDEVHRQEVSNDQLNESSNSSSDEDEPAFMRCGSIESIIHQSPDISPGNSEHTPLSSRRSWPHSMVQRQQSLSTQRLARSWDFQDIPRLKGQDVVIDIGTSSTDDDIYSISSDDERVLFQKEMGSADGQSVYQEEINDKLNNSFNLVDNDEDEDDEILEPPSQSLSDQQLNSQDWEVQMLAQQLAEEQRGVARKIDKDIASGRLQSPLADLHEALATDNLSNLKECDLLRLEKIVRKEREKLRQYARMYSLDERPVLEDEFSSLYRSRSQLLLSRSSELCRADSTDRRLLKLLSQLTSLPPSEQFLLDRLVYKSARSRKMSRQQSLCDERLSAYNQRGMRLHVNSNAAMRRSVSMCSPPPEPRQITRQASSSVDHTVHPITRLAEAGATDMDESVPSTVSSMLARLQRSVSISDSESSHRSDNSRKEIQPNTKPAR